MTMILVLCIFGLSLAEVSASAPFRKGSVYCEGLACKFKDGVLDFEKASAYGTFNDTLMVTGWGILDVVAGKATSGPKQPDVDIMFAAGFIEGVFTADHMEKQFINMFDSFFPKPVDKKLKAKLDEWLQEQRGWVDSQINEHRDDPFWRHASYIFSQLDGLYAGYKSVKGHNKDSLDMFAINYLNANGDMPDLIFVLRNLSTENGNHRPWANVEEYFQETHCSALIKLLPGYENLLMTHATWFDYSNINRIYKHYDFDVKDPKTAARKISFSSYPAIISSLDDFYQLGSGMVMLQTTNLIIDTTLYELVKPQSLLAWQRVRIASMMARNGEEWTEIVASYNSGTYNNQYMLIDLKLVMLKKPLPDNTLWVAEQIPGLVVTEDLTHVLQYGYFPSYNIPYFEEIFNKSGYPAYVKKYGNAVTYQLAPRAEIFRRDQPKVNDLASLKKLMRTNDYKHDPYSYGTPWGALCARGDLAKNPRPFGCYDAKVCDLEMAKRFEAEIISGPTPGTNLPPFTWAEFNNTAHVGLPETYNFPYIKTKPRFD